MGEAIRASAGDRHQSVSAWLAEAARDRLRLEAIGRAVAFWEQEHGPLTEAEIAAADASSMGGPERGPARRRWSSCWTPAG